MGFITSLFGESSGSILTVVFALGVVLVLIVLAVWLLKLLYTASGKVARGRNRRLGVVESLAIDQKRQLLVIRRDNVEHLLLIGGPHDLVVETGIPVPEVPPTPTGRRPVPLVPTAKPRPANAPAAAPGAPVAPAAPVVAPEPTAIERLRDIGKPAAKAKSAKSLRHTGLMRPGEQAENAGNPDNGPLGAADSAKDDATQSVVEDADRDDHKDASRS